MFKKKRKKKKATFPILSFFFLSISFPERNITLVVADAYKVLLNGFRIGQKLLKIVGKLRNIYLGI